MSDLDSPPARDAPTAQPLEYAKAAPSARRQAWRRAVVGLLVVAALVGGWVGFRRGYREFRERRVLVVAYRDSAKFSAGPDLMVYGEGADAKAMSDGTAATYAQRYTGWESSRVKEPTARMFALGVQPWHQTAAALALRGPGTGASPEATVFCHQRRSSNGQRRVVAVSVSTWQRRGSLFGISGAGVSATPPVEFAAVTLAPVTYLETRPAVRQGVTPLGAWPATGATAVRFYAGQADPSDEARFTVRYSVGGAQGTIAGKLRDDGTVELTVRDGPWATAAGAP